MKRYHVGLVLITVWIAGTCGLLAIRLVEKRTDQRIARFCMATRDAIRQDRRAFEDGDDAARVRAFDRFYEGEVMFHNSASVAMCVGDDVALPPLPVGCRLHRDWSCMATVARDLEQLLPRAP